MAAINDAIAAGAIAIVTAAASIAIVTAAVSIAIVAAAASRCHRCQAEPVPWLAPAVNNVPYV